ncbi:MULTISPECIES: M20 family metallopeptidase [unclassified Oceanispirochaeta]|uniref:M20 family metallopeptidase n=1 Tax=unclassified Oceanispirochaeta TaxID=2635722 RepID=UPI000E09C200|nr:MULTISPECIES: ArgE/DapE family deacylase [unclassified Oceanispirochaeta]RDG33158.1 M20 family peptidase [Oceanispirochaeta sp. M1]
MQQSELITLLEKMIRIESINGNEKNLGEFLYSFCELQGLGVEKQYCTENRFNVLITYPPTPLSIKQSENPQFGLLLHGHYDTVPGLDMTDPFEPVINGDLMHGRGTVDQKAGIAACIIALVNLRRQGVVLEKPVCLAAVIDEESEHQGSMKLVETGIRAEYSIITEPTGLNAVLGCKGTLPVKITVIGKASHGCRPWLGVNAVEMAMPILQRLFSFNFEEKDFGVGLGVLKNSINVGLVQAGTAYNNVPDKCEISLDCRVIPGDTNESMMECIQNILNEAKSENPTLKASLTVDRPDWNWEPVKERGLRSAQTSRKSPLFKLMKEVHTCVTGNDLGSYITDGYTDMDFIINDLNIPCIVYGPGNPRLCHTSAEEISLHEVETSMRFYEEFIKKQCAAAEELEGNRCV